MDYLALENLDLNTLQEKVIVLTHKVGVAEAEFQDLAAEREELSSEQARLNRQIERAEAGDFSWLNASESVVSDCIVNEGFLSEAEDLPVPDDVFALDLGRNSISLRWFCEDISGHTSFEVLQEIHRAGATKSPTKPRTRTFEVAASPADEQTTTLTGLVFGKRYVFGIRSCDGAGRVSRLSGARVEVVPQANGKCEVRMVVEEGMEEAPAGPAGGGGGSEAQEFVLSEEFVREDRIGSVEAVAGVAPKQAAEEVSELSQNSGDAAGAPPVLEENGTKGESYRSPSLIVSGYFTTQQYRDKMGDSPVLSGRATPKTNTVPSKGAAAVRSENANEMADGDVFVKNDFARSAEGGGHDETTPASGKRTPAKGKRTRKGGKFASAYMEHRAAAVQSDPPSDAAFPGDDALPGKSDLSASERYEVAGAVATQTTSTKEPLAEPGADVSQDVNFLARDRHPPSTEEQTVRAVVPMSEGRPPAAEKPAPHRRETSSPDPRNQSKENAPIPDPTVPVVTPVVLHTPVPIKTQQQRRAQELAQISKKRMNSWIDAVLARSAVSGKAPSRDGIPKSFTFSGAGPPSGRLPRTPASGRGPSHHPPFPRSLSSQKPDAQHARSMPLDAGAVREKAASKGSWVGQRSQPLAGGGDPRDASNYRLQAMREATATKQPAKPREKKLVSPNTSSSSGGGSSGEKDRRKKMKPPVPRAASRRDDRVVRPMARNEGPAKDDIAIQGKRAPPSTKHKSPQKSAAPNAVQGLRIPEDAAVDDVPSELRAERDQFLGVFPEQNPPRRSRGPSTDHDDTMSILSSGTVEVYQPIPQRGSTHTLQTLREDEIAKIDQRLLDQAEAAVIRSSPDRSPELSRNASGTSSEGLFRNGNSPPPAGGGQAGGSPPRLREVLGAAEEEEEDSLEATTPVVRGGARRNGGGVLPGFFTSGGAGSAGARAQASDATTTHPRIEELERTPGTVVDGRTPQHRLPEPTPAVSSSLSPPMEAGLEATVTVLPTGETTTLWGAAGVAPAAKPSSAAPEPRGGTGGAKRDAAAAPPVIIGVGGEMVQQQQVAVPAKYPYPSNGGAAPSYSGGGQLSGSLMGTVGALPPTGTPKIGAGFPMLKPFAPLPRQPILGVGGPSRLPPPPGYPSSTAAAVEYTPTSSRPANGGLHQYQTVMNKMLPPPGTGSLSGSDRGYHSSNPPDMLGATVNVLPKVATPATFLQANPDFMAFMQNNPLPPSPPPQPAGVLGPTYGGGPTSSSGAQYGYRPGGSTQPPPPGPSGPPPASTYVSYPGVPPMASTASSSAAPGAGPPAADPNYPYAAHTTPAGATYFPVDGFSDPDDPYASTRLIKAPSFRGKKVGMSPSEHSSSAAAQGAANFYGGHGSPSGGGGGAAHHGGYQLTVQLDDAVWDTLKFGPTEDLQNLGAEFLRRNKKNMVMLEGLVKEMQRMLRSSLTRGSVDLADLLEI